MDPLEISSSLPSLWFSLRSHFLDLTLFANWRGWEFHNSQVLLIVLLSNTPFSGNLSPLAARRNKRHFQHLIGNAWREITSSVDTFCSVHRTGDVLCSFWPQHKEDPISSSLQSHVPHFLSWPLAVSLKCRFLPVVCSRYFRLSPHASPNTSSLCPSPSLKATPTFLGIIEAPHFQVLVSFLAIYAI